MSKRFVKENIQRMSHIDKTKWRVDHTLFLWYHKVRINLTKNCQSQILKKPSPPPSSPDIATFYPPHIFWCNPNMILSTYRIIIRQWIDWRDMVLFNWNNICATVADRTVAVLRMIPEVVGLASADGTYKKFSPKNGTTLRLYDIYVI